MNLNDFIALIRDELGLPVTREDLPLSFDELSGWDSMYILWLLTVLEHRTSQHLRLTDLLAAPDLEHVYALVMDE